MAATFDSIMKELQNGSYAPIYLLMGEEAYYIDVVSDYIEKNAIPEAEQAFNQSVYYGNKDVKLKDIAHDASQYPMMAERRLVMLKEAQVVEHFKDHIADLAAYAEHYVETTILVVCFKNGTIDKRSKFVKIAEKIGRVLESPKMWPNQIPAWIVSHVNSVGLGIEQRAADLLAEHIGANLSNIASAIDKLKRICADEKKQTLTVDMVTTHIGVSNEYNVFELRDAIFARNVAKVNRILKAFAGNEKQNPIQKITPYLFGCFQKLLAYHYMPDKKPQIVAQVLGDKSVFAPNNFYELGRKNNYTAMKCLKAIELIREYDMKSKGYKSPQISSGDALLELIFQIMNL